MAGNTRFAVVLDAGSSGTRLYVYKWVEVAQGGPLPAITVVFSKDTTDGRGIATCTTAGQVQTHLNPLFVAADGYFNNLDPAPDRAEIPLWLLGTAGLRDFRAVNDGAYNVLMNLIRVDLGGRGYQPAPEEAPRCRVISGKEEAIYGWVAANYAAKRLAAGVLPHGYVEMGGASTQIAYPPTDREMASYRGNLVRLQIGAETYDLYAKSFPFGAEKAWSAHEARLRPTGGAACAHAARAQCNCANITDPCRPVGCTHEIPDPNRNPVGAKIVGGGNDYRRCVYAANAILRILADPNAIMDNDAAVAGAIATANGAATQAGAVALVAENAAKAAKDATIEANHKTRSAHKDATEARQRFSDATIPASVARLLAEEYAMKLKPTTDYLTRQAEKAGDGGMEGYMGQSAKRALAGAKRMVDDKVAKADQADTDRLPATKAMFKAEAALSAATAAEASTAAASNAAADAADKAEAEADEVKAAALEIVKTLGAYPPVSGPNPDIHPRQLQQSLDLLAGGPKIDFGAREFAGGSQFWYTTRMVFGRDFLGNSLRGSFNYLDFRREVRQMITRPWANKPAGVKDDYWMKAFFVAGFITNVVYYGFNFPRQLTRQDRSVFQPYNGEDTTLTWTLGKILLMAVNTIPSNITRPVVPVVATWEQIVD